MVIARARIALVDALRVQSAEFWLRLGEPLQALRELERLPRRVRRHPWAEAVFTAALGTLREPGYFETLAAEAGHLVDLPKVRSLRPAPAPAPDCCGLKLIHSGQRNF